MVRGWAWGPRRAEARLRMVLDTGAGMTIIAPAVLQSLGYGPHHRESRTVIRSAVGEERGYTVRVKHFRCLGFDFINTLIHEHALPEGWQIDGLLGWDILQRFDFDVRPQEGHLVVWPAAGERP